MVNFLKQKNQVLNSFKEYKVLTKKQTKKLLKRLRLENASEYISNAFNQFCRDNGTTRQLTMPYTPKQNSVVERNNRFLQECAKNMLKQIKVPNYFWAKAIGI